MAKLQWLIARQTVSDSNHGNEPNHHLHENSVTIEVNNSEGRGVA